MDYASLQTAMAGFLGRTDLTDELPLFIQQAESRIYRRLRVSAMVKTATLTPSDGSASVPEDYLEALELRITHGSPLERAPAFWSDQRFNTNRTGAPYYYARVGDVFRFAPSQDNVSLTLTYYGRLPALSVDQSSNWLTTSAPDLLLAGALVEGFAWVADAEGLQYATRRFEQALQACQTMDRQERSSGSTPVMRRG